MRLLFFVFLIISSVTPSLFAGCPTQSKALTLNGMGDSSYYDTGYGNLMSLLNQKGVIQFSGGSLIVGGGYGKEAYELLKLGANKITLNDLSIANLKCAKNFLSLKFPKSNISYLAGDITEKLTAKKLGKKQFNLITASNVVGFLDGNQINNFFSLSYKRLIPGGSLLITFENPLIENLLAMRNEVTYKMIKNNTTKDFAVNEAFSRYTFGPSSLKCSINDYRKTLATIRSEGFPCILRTSSGFMNYILPSEAQRLLENNGFKVLLNTHLTNKTATLILAKKPF